MSGPIATTRARLNRQGGDAGLRETAPYVHGRSTVGPGDSSDELGSALESVARQEARAAPCVEASRKAGTQARLDFCCQAISPVGPGSFCPCPCVPFHQKNGRCDRLK